MKELVSKIQEVYATFSTDAALQIEKGNKAAGTRARKTSLELEKLMKEFRKLSLEESKNNLYTSGRYHIMPVLLQMRHKNHIGRTT